MTHNWDIDFNFKGVWCCILGSVQLNVLSTHLCFISRTRTYIYRRSNHKYIKSSHFWLFVRRIHLSLHKGQDFGNRFHFLTSSCTLRPLQSHVSVIAQMHCLHYSDVHYDDVRMGAIASQITSLTIVNSTVYSNADQRKHQSSASLAFVWGIHRDWWIPRTKGQLRGKCFHLMTSSCYKSIMTSQR